MLMRGGTSKGVFFLEDDLPKDRDSRDRFLLRVMGSPDSKQIDGLGGATSVTSKVAIIGVSRRPDADIDYTFAQVSVDKPLVSYKGNCGNISSAVGPFAIERRLVAIEEPVTTVRIYNTNTDKIIEAEVQTSGGHVKYDGDYEIGGVPGSGSPIKLKFVDPSGTISPRLLTTGNAVDEIQIPGMSSIRMSLVDAANPLVFVSSKDVGLKGTELPSEIDQNPEVLKKLETVRGMAAVRLGLIDDYQTSAWECPGLPKMTLVSPPQDYVTSNGRHVKAGEVDIVARMMSMQKAHPSYAMTGAMCTAAAAAVPGSIVAKAMRDSVNLKKIRIGHPGGILEVGVEYESGESEPNILGTFGYRTANLLLDGNAFCRV
ncbi:2-methylaconitate cis-trans isomerase PrpF family protein [Corynebacterium poyangense]|nr:PrpF domain-containing protein [Corynebacterium poyangense]